MTGVRMLISEIKSRVAAMAIVLSFVLIALVVGVGVAAPASATTAPDDGSTTIRSGQTFYAYVESGETIDVRFAQRYTATQEATTITVAGPGGINESCVINANATSGTACEFTDLTSAETGIWRIEFAPPVEYGTQFFWQIDVQAEGADVPGRVWSDRYRMYNTDVASFPLWYVANNGYIYEATFNGYMGIDSIFESDQFGAVEVGTCISAYESYDAIGPDADPQFEVSGGRCGVRYHIFFEAPSSDLPAEALLPNGADTMFVSPEWIEPTLSSVSFVSSGEANHAGELSFTAANHVGAVTIEVYADGADTPVRTMPGAVTQSGTGSVAFNGLDDDGEEIPLGDELTFKVSILQAGEIHFTSTDVERRDSISVVALAGPAAGDSVLYWNDTALETDERSCVTAEVDGTSGVDSSAGVHGWSCSQNANNGEGGSWGDVRVIDDWMYTQVNVSDSITVTPNLSVTKSSNPVSTSEVATGDVIDYSLTFTNTGTAPVAVDYVDFLSDVIDDAEISTMPTSDSPLLSASEVVDGQFTIAGAVAAGATATVQYSVTVNTVDERNNDALNNYLVAVMDGEDPTPPAECLPADALCTFHPVVEPNLSVSKGSDPASTTEVKAGEQIDYTLTFANSGNGAAEVNYVDFISDVLDDATVTAAPVSSDASLTATAVTDGQFTVSGTLEPGATVVVRYSVTVNDEGERGNDRLDNYLVPIVEGEDPIAPDECVEESVLCTTHPIVPEAPGAPAGPTNPLATTGGQLPIVLSAAAGAMVVLGITLMVLRRRRAQ